MCPQGLTAQEVQKQTCTMQSSVLASMQHVLKEHVGNQYILKYCFFPLTSLPPCCSSCQSRAGCASLVILIYSTWIFLRKVASVKILILLVIHSKLATCYWHHQNSLVVLTPWTFFSAAKDLNVRQSLCHCAFAQGMWECLMVSAEWHDNHELADGKSTGGKKRARPFAFFLKERVRVAFVESSVEWLNAPVEPALTQGYNHDEPASLTDQVIDTDAVFWRGNPVVWPSKLIQSLFETAQTSST